MQESLEIPAEVVAAWCAEWERFADPSTDPVPDAAEDAFVGPLTGWAAVEHEHDQLLAEWEHASAQVARWQAVQTRVLADALEHALREGTAGRTPELEVRSLAAEMALAVGVSDRTVAGQMADALLMREHYPATLDTLRQGRMTRAHAQVIVDEGTRLDEPARAEYERIVLERADGLTVGRLRQVAKAIAVQLDPVPLAERHREAREDRYVAVRDADDGMAELRALIPAVLAQGLHDRLTTMARTIQGAERAAAEAAETETGAPGLRGLDQIRADVFCDLLLTGHPTVQAADTHGGDGLGGIRGIVQITLPAPVLAGQPTRVPATLPGGTPIDPDTARTLAGSATIWDLVHADPATGDVLTVDRRFPTAHQRRHLQARDEHCRFPGCRMPVWRSDIDHTIDHAYGGPTEPGNLAHLCRRHHTLKHHTAWRVEQRAHGILTWISPTGRTYTDRPPPTLRFMYRQRPEDDPAESAA